MKLVVSGRPPCDEPVEIVERKGLGHPDSICDALAETLSRNLCRHYLERFGAILHYNVDKALLCGGSAVPAFGGGHVEVPIDIHLSGRAVGAVGTHSIPIDEIAIEGSRAWLRENLHALDADRHVRLHNAVRPGSQALVDLCGRRPVGTGKVLANDTSIGVPVEAPAFTHVRLATHDGGPVGHLEAPVGDIVARQLSGAASLVDCFVAGSVQVC